MPFSDVPFADWSAVELGRAVRAGRISVVEIVQASLDRIARLDRVGPALHAVIETNPDALTIAAMCDDELRAGVDRGPLHGIPVVVKDNIATADGMQNTTGARALEGAWPLRDAGLISALREAGAVIVGKANLSEWSSMRALSPHEGWSGRGGFTRNPHRPTHGAWGSSSGSAVAVAAGYVPLSVATETAGSIAYPASATGIVGIKPTVGLVSRRGVIPISHFQDSPGPMARTVPDLALLLTVLSREPDAGDLHAQRSPVTAGDPQLPPRPTAASPGIDYRAGLDSDALRGARLGVHRTGSGFSAEAEAVFDALLPVLRSAGAVIIDPVEVPGYDEILRTRSEQVATYMAETRSGFERYATEFIDPAFPVRTIADVVAYNQQHPESGPAPDQGFLQMIADAPDDSEPAVRADIARFQALAREGLQAAFATHRLDALISPAVAPAPFIDPAEGHLYPLGASTLSALAGYPIASVPAGFYDGLPVGIALTGLPWSEQPLLSLMHAVQTHHRDASRPPRF